MLRFYKQFIEQVFLTLLHARDHYGPDFQTVSNYAIEHWRYEDTARNRYHTPELIRVVRGILDSNSLEGWSLTELINEMAAQIGAAQLTRGTSFGDKDLIDTIVRTIQLPFARNRFSGEVLDSLKKALLLPEEAAGLKEKLQREELSCVQCGHHFIQGEMGTISIDRRGSVLVCGACVTPTLIPCGSGKHVISMPRGVAKSILREREKACEECAIETSSSTAGTAVPEAPENIGAAGVGAAGVGAGPTTTRLRTAAAHVYEIPEEIGRIERDLLGNPIQSVPPALPADHDHPTRYRSFVGDWTTRNQQGTPAATIIPNFISWGAPNQPVQWTPIQYTEGQPAGDADGQLIDEDYEEEEDIDS